MPGKNLTQSQVNSLIENKLITKNSELGIFKLTPNDYIDVKLPKSFLVYLAAEHEGVGLIAYFGINNQVLDGP